MIHVVGLRALFRNFKLLNISKFNSKWKTTECLIKSVLYRKRKNKISIQNPNISDIHTDNLPLWMPDQNNNNNGIEYAVCNMVFSCWFFGFWPVFDMCHEFRLRYATISSMVVPNFDRRCFDDDKFLGK